MSEASPFVCLEGTLQGHSQVVWSNRLEVLAEGLFRQWEICSQHDPFAQFCVVVSDLATRDWLQHTFLMHPCTVRRQILANITFVPIAEFVNDWLAAQVHQRAGVRKASEHPYAKGVLAWRIEAILRDHGGEARFAPLQRYLEGCAPDQVARKRYALAVQLATLFDGYLAARHTMLRRWEQGRHTPGEEAWQVALYRLLVQESPETYARDYEMALAAEAPPEKAFEAGFPRYAGVAVFDVSVAPRPYLHMLRQVARVLPTVWWTFNPSYDYWLDDATKPQAARDFAQALTQALHSGGTLPVDTQFFPTPASPLLGALASGGRAVLVEELAIENGNFEWKGDTEDFKTLAESSPEIHACTGPRRELEVAKEAMHRFFAEHPDAQPSDAVLLCADWATYAPLVEAVFMGGTSGQIPVQLQHAPQSQSAVAQAWERLLAFRDNRFEASAVFDLLGCPEVRLRFGFALDEVGILREIVRQNNLHWGFDAADVAQTLHQNPESPPDEAQTPFTWRRGLDRLVVDALYGPSAGGPEMVALAGLGAVLPVGEVEGERAESVGKLAAFVAALHRLRKTLRGERTAEAWQETLLKTLELFFLAEAGEALIETNAIRRAIVSTAREMVVARNVAHRLPESVPGDLVCQAVLQAIKMGFRGASTASNAVRVAPLTLGAAMPAQFVWICGLNDGTFPRVDFKPSFDLVWRKPTLFDVCTREMDGYAFLKAILGARKKLGLSYIGVDPQSLKPIPASVFLLDLEDWLHKTNVTCPHSSHPLQAHSPRYFLDAAEKMSLPRAFSAANREIAVRLCNAIAPEEEEQTVVPFIFASSSTPRTIALEDLAAFYAHPCRTIARKRLGITPPRLNKVVLNDEDAMELSPAKSIVAQNLLQHDALMADPMLLTRLREMGCSLSEQEIRAKLEELATNYNLLPLRYFAKERKPFSTTLTLLEAARKWCDEAELCDLSQQVTVAGQAVTVTGQAAMVTFETTGKGTLAHLFRFGDCWTVDDGEMRAAWVFHVAGHAAGLHFATVLMGLNRAIANVFPSLEDRKAAQALFAAMVNQALTPCPFSLDRAIDYKKDAPQAAFDEVLQMPTPWATVDVKPKKSAQ